MAAVEGVESDHMTVWQVGVLNDTGVVYRRIVAEGPTESLTIIECFAKQAFRLMEQEGLAVFRRGQLPAH